MHADDARTGEEQTGAVGTPATQARQSMLLKRSGARLREDDRRLNGHNQTEATFLYVMECGGKVKIGIAANVEARIGHMQPGNPIKIEVRHTRQFATRTAARNVERSLHSRFAEKRIWGEWFDIAVEVAVEAVLAAGEDAEPVLLPLGPKKRRPSILADLPFSMDEVIETWRTRPLTPSGMDGEK